MNLLLAGPKRLVLFLVVKIQDTGWVVGSDGLGFYAQLRSAVVDKGLYANDFLEYNKFGDWQRN